MQRIPRDQARKFAFDWRDEPLLRVRPGETFEVETWDASNGYFRTEQDLAVPGRRPGFDKAAPPEEARRLYELVAAELRKRGTTVETGVFAAYMKLTLVNDGPVTFVLDSREGRG